MKCIVACRPVTTKQHPLLSNRFLISGYTQPLLSNAFENKHLPTEIIGVQKWTVFSKRSVPRCYKEDNWSNLCGGGVEYLHRSPASRRRRRKGNPVTGGTTWPRCSWGIWIRGRGPSGWGSLESGSWVPRDSNLRMTALARTSSNCKRQTHPLARENVTWGL
jgi:hypothetical protein